LSLNISTCCETPTGAARLESRGGPHPRISTELKSRFPGLISSNKVRLAQRRWEAERCRRSDFIAHKPHPQLDNISSGQHPRDPAPQGCRCTQASPLFSANVVPPRLRFHPPEMVKPNDAIALIITLHILICILIGICLCRCVRVVRPPSTVSLTPPYPNDVENRPGVVPIPPVPRLIPIPPVGGTGGGGIVNARQDPGPARGAMNVRPDRGRGGAVNVLRGTRGRGAVNARP
jgi:hypothetical protein